MTYPLVLELAATDAPLRVPVAVPCRVLGFSTKAYYKWRANPVCARDLDDAYLTNAAIDLHADDPELSYRLIADDLRDAGHQVSDNRVWRLCSAQRLWSAHSKKRGLNRKPGPPVHDDLLAVVDKHGRTTHTFTANAPNAVWLTDISEHPTAEGKLYMCAVKDLHSNKIVGYSIDSRMKSSLAVTALRNAVSLRSPQATIVHSDRGSQFRSRKYVNALKNAGLQGSMGRVGACGDNAAMESFFALLQKNVLNRKRWETREELAPSGDRDLDREDLPPQTPPSRPRQTYPGSTVPLELSGGS